MRPASLALAGLAVAMAAVAGCLGQDGADDDAPEAPAAQGAEVGVRFLAIGDMGTGGQDQARVAEAMVTVCATLGCDFVVGLGDLIYPAGASSPTDPQFDEKFEVPYADLDVPFWMVLGNHDNSEDPAGTGATGGLGLWYQAGNHEVAYAQRADRASDKWHMPARHYTFSEGGVDFIGLDTNTLLFYGVAFPPDLALSVQEQEAWLPGAVAEGEGAWNIALGHHPYLSNGEHGDAGEYDGLPVPGANGDHLKAVFESSLCDRIDLYLAGHDHDLIWLDPTPACGRTHFIVSGGGGASLYDLLGDGEAAFQKKSLGFWWLEVQADTLRAVAYDDSATPLYDRSIAKPIPPRAD